MQVLPLLLELKEIQNIKNEINSQNSEFDESLNDRAHQSLYDFNKSNIFEADHTSPYKRVKIGNQKPNRNKSDVVLDKMYEENRPRKMNTDYKPIIDKHQAFRESVFKFNGQESPQEMRHSIRYLQLNYTNL